MTYQPVTPEIVHDLRRIVGVKRIQCLPQAMDETVIAQHRRILAAFDPAHILNPGKMIEPAVRSLSDSHQ